MKRVRKSATVVGKKTKIVSKGETPIVQEIVEHDDSVSEALLQIETDLAASLVENVSLSHPVAYVYNPLQYAYDAHAAFVRKFARHRVEYLFVGMNPGPWGMSQTGIPFGEVSIVKSWMGIETEVGRPVLEHPKRPVLGFQCHRSEVSGKRFWGYFRQLTGNDPNRFFQHCFVHNYIPLAFIKDSGANVTPPELKIGERNALFSYCDEALIKILLLLNVRVVIAVGKFAEQRTRVALKSAGVTHVQLHSILHPSPLNPRANKEWATVVHEQLSGIGVVSAVVSSG